MSRVQSSALRKDDVGLPQPICAELCALNSELWLVGGPVRDHLLGRPCHDWDFVCRGAKKAAQRTSRRLHASFVTLDEQNRIYRVIVPSPQPSTDGRGRSAADEPITLDFAELQGKSIQEDLARRDLTINAMALPLTSFRRKPESSQADWTPASAGVTTLIDPFHGQKDLQKRIIRAVSEKAFTDDPLRMVRVFRFAAQFQFAIEPRTLRWVKKHSAALSHVSLERIREELLRLWKQPRSHAALRLMDQAHVLSAIFPEIEACRRTAVRYYGQGGVLRHALQTVENLEWIFQQTKETEILAYLQERVGGYPRLAWLKWGAFLHDVGKPATAKVIKRRLRFFEHEHVGAALTLRIAKRLRCSRQEVQQLGLWVRNHMRLGNLAAAARITDKAIARYFRDLGEAGIGMIFISLADHYTYLSKSKWGKQKDPVERMAQRLFTAYYMDRAKILPPRVINGHQIMKHLRIKPGPMIGKILEAIQDAQAEGKVTSKQEALLMAKNLVLRKG